MMGASERALTGKQEERSATPYRMLANSLLLCVHSKGLLFVQLSK